MKEITRIITSQITIIEQMTDEDAELIVASKEEAEKNVVKTLQKLYGADDVTVQIQDFAREVQ